MARRTPWLALICVACGGAAPARVQAAQEQARVPSVTVPALRIMSPLDPLTRELRFARDAVELLPEDATTLEEIVEALRDERLTLVIVSGHGDSGELPNIGDARASRVIELLVARGVDRARLEARPPEEVAPRERGGRCGLGAPSASDDERERAEERWVRFTIARTTLD